MILFPDSDIDRLRIRLDKKSPVTIITHYNPDGDALGSSLALQLFLESMGYNVDCVLPSSFPTYYDWLPHINKALVYEDKNKLEFAPYFEDDRIIFCLDFNTSSRVNLLTDYLSNSNAFKVLIDYHEEPGNEFDISFSYPGTSSTCELVYHFIQKFKPENINLNIATCLYTGLITDTGGFQFSSTHASTFHMASHLVKLGVNVSNLYNLSFNNFSLNRLKLFGHCIANNMIIVEDKKLAYIWIDKKTKDLFNIQDGDTEGLVNYPMKVSDIEVSILFKQDYEKVRISFRSKTNVDVSQIAKQHFNGGGHKNAAGGMMKLKLKDTLTYFEQLIPELF